MNQIIYFFFFCKNKQNSQDLYNHSMTKYMLPYITLMCALMKEKDLLLKSHYDPKGTREKFQGTMHAT